MTMNVRQLIRQYNRPLGILIGFIRLGEAFLEPDDDYVEKGRRRVFETAQRLFGDYHTFIYNIGNADYVTTVDMTPDELEELLWENGYKRNLVSARKYRIPPDGAKQWAHGSWALYNNEGHQHHVYIFESKDGGTDLYAHTEDNATDPAAHLHVEDDEDDIAGMKHADPAALLELFDNTSIEYKKRDFNND